MDISTLIEGPLLPAPRAVFDNLAERATSARFMVPSEGDWRPITWQSFAHSIQRVTLALDHLGLEPGERAAILAPNSVPWLSAALGIQALGGVMVPIYPSSTAEQIAYVVEHSDARVLFIDTEALLTRVLSIWHHLDEVEHLVLLTDDIDIPHLLSHMRDDGLTAPDLAQVEACTLHWDQATALGAARHREDPQAFERLMMAIDLDQPGVMLYTSGTSGPPKGVPLTHRNVAVNGRDWLQCNAPLLTEGMVDLLWLPVSHIFGFGEACLGNTLGFTTYMTDPTRVLEHLPQVRPDVFMSVPSYWEKLAQGTQGAESLEGRVERLKSLTGGRLRFCLSGGAGLSREVKALFKAADMLIIEGYGLTEASPTLTLNRPDDFDFTTVGKPLPSVELRLAEDGEILARGPSIFSGYHKNEAATAEAFTKEGWLRTGDLGRWTEGGFLQIIGRKKEILVTRSGKNIAPANIELRFKDDPLISHLVVYGDDRRYLVAGAWLASDASGDDLDGLVQARVEAINAQLARFETIKRVAIMTPALSVDSGHLTPTLKLRRKQVYADFNDQFEALYR